MLLLILSVAAQAQYSISGYTCVIPGSVYGPYTINGNVGSNGGVGDKWCVTNGTINGSACFISQAPSVGVTWNSGASTGTISYYRPANSPTPVATLNVNIAANTINSPSIPGFFFPFVPQNQVILMTITGNTPACTAWYINYYWQKSTDGGNTYVTIPNSGGKDYQVLEAYSTQTYYRRAMEMDSRTSYSVPQPVVPVAPVNASPITPAYVITKANTTPAVSFSRTGNASGGAMCSGNYQYFWETSTDLINWTAAGSSTNFSPGNIAVKTYVRQRVQCSPVGGFSNVAIIDVYKPLSGGTIAPFSTTIASGTSPGPLSGNPAGNGNTSLPYTYEWQYSTNNGLNWNSIGSTNILSYTPTGVTVNTLYRRRVICDGETAYSNTVAVNVGTVNALNQNYIESRELQRGGVTDAPSAYGLANLRDVRQTTTYFDGLGRALQSVQKQGSLVSNSAPTDLVLPRQYDEMGRETITYLPYAATSNDGLFKINPTLDHQTFNNQQFGTTQGENFFYSVTELESSALNRVRKTMSAGNSWVGNGTGIRSGEFVNTAADGVRTFGVSASTIGNFASYSIGGLYLPGTLFKSILTDENGKQVIEFKDKQGRLILKKTQLTASADDGSGSDFSGWLCTYYLYDIIGNVRCAIQPRGVELLIQNNWDLNALSGAILNEQCFRYEFDQSNRMIMKKLPGADPIFYIYDRWDRVILTQDGNMRPNNIWHFTKYDQYNRPIMTGYHGDGSNIGLAAMINHVKNNESWLTRYESVDYTKPHGYTTTQTYPYGTNPGALTVIYYDNYDWIASSGSGLSGTLSTTDINGSNFITSYNMSPDFAQELQQNTRTVGMITGTKSVQLGTSNYLFNVNIYDRRGNLIQVQSTNINNGKDYTTTQFSFNGKPLRSVTRHQKPGSNDQTHVILSKNEYDDLWRLTAIKRSVNSTLPGPLAVNKPEVEIVRNEYDALGQVKTKALGKKKDASGNYINTPLETLDYEYNIRGWILGVNRNYLIDNATGKYFGFELGYDKQANKANKPFASAMVNGNINGMIWKSMGNGLQRKYDFGYDHFNRLMKADFEQHNADGSWGFGLVNYSVKMGDGTDPATAYDANGNILRMQQWGLKVTGSQQVDDLRYTYYAGTNRLRNVVDFNNEPLTKLGDFRTSTLHPQQAQKTGYIANQSSVDINTITDYTYDVNGNLKKDLNKDLGSSGTDGITYNYLNLPEVLTVRNNTGGTKGTITNYYDASGKRLKKVTVDNSVAGKTVTTTTLYIHPFIYETKLTSPAAPDDYTERLMYVEQEEGRIRFTPAIGNEPNHFDYDFFIRDHLQNVRMILTDEKKQSVYPAATLEGNIATPGLPNAVNKEQEYYTIVQGNIADRAEATGITNYPNHNGSPPYNTNPFSDVGVNSQKLYRMEAAAVPNGGVTGLGITLKVMSGDKIDIFGNSYYFQNNTGTQNYDVPVLSILDGLLGAPKSPAGGKTTSGELNIVSMVTGAIGTFLQHPDRNNNGTSTTPKAYINYILLDENFRVITGKFSRVGGPNSVKLHQQDAVMQNIDVTQNGYIYVYVSNESPVKVYFDNLQVIHTPGPLVEESHYYPFGLLQAGISSKALAYENAKNKIRYNGYELNQDFDLHLHETFFRSHDPQLGRFWQLDSKPHEAISMYAGMNNNPIGFADPLGDTIIFTAAFLATKFGKQIMELYKNSETFKKMLAAYDIGGEGSFFGGEAGAQANTTNVVFDVINDTQKDGTSKSGGGSTSFQVQDKNGKWVDGGLVAPGDVSKDSKTRINILLNPDAKESNTLQKAANITNHELTAHGLGFLNISDILHNNGTQAFGTYRTAGNLVHLNKESYKNDILQNGYYNPRVQHALIGAGLNEHYNAITKELSVALEKQGKSALPSDVGSYKPATREMQKAFKNLSDIKQFGIYGPQQE